MIEVNTIRDFIKYIYYYLPWMIAGVGFISVVVIASLWMLMGKPEEERFAERLVDQDQIASQFPHISPHTVQPTSTVYKNDSVQTEQQFQNEISVLVPDQTDLISFGSPQPLLEIVGLHDQVKPQQEYVVKTGDTLWQLASDYLGDGTRYLDIALANQIADPDILLVGKTIILNSAQLKQVSRDQILTGITTEKTHQVQAGQSLWIIAEEELGDSYQWAEIYEINKAHIGDNPNQIEVDQVLIMP